MKKQFLIVILLSSIGLGASPVDTTRQERTASAVPSTRLQLRPFQVVYQQVEGTFLKSPQGVWVDKARKEVYVADTSNNLIAVYDEAGLPLFSFGYNQELKEPVKAVADSSGRILVLNGIPRAIKIFSYRGEYLQDFPLKVKAGDGEPNPTALSVDQKGNIYIADTSSRQISVYDSSFQLIREFGKKPDGGSHLNTVQGMVVDTDGTVYVADATATPSIQVFSPDGEFLRGWGAHDAGPHNFSLPSGLSIDGQGRIVVVDMMRHTITIFTKDGTYLGRHGGFGRQPGAISYPTDIASNGKEKLYVVERLGSRLQVLQEEEVAVRRRASAPKGLNPSRGQIQQGLRDFMKEMQ